MAEVIKLVPANAEAILGEIGATTIIPSNPQAHQPEDKEDVLLGWVYLPKSNKAFPPKLAGDVQHVFHGDLDIRRCNNGDVMIGFEYNLGETIYHLLGDLGLKTEKLRVPIQAMDLFLKKHLRCSLLAA